MLYIYILLFVFLLVDESDSDVPSDNKHNDGKEIDEGEMISMGIK